MPNSAQAIKRLRQDKVRNLRNRMAKNELRTLTKKILAAVEAGNKEEAEKLLRFTQGKFDKAAKSNVYHAKTISRRKALLFRTVNKLNS